MALLSAALAAVGVALLLSGGACDRLSGDRLSGVRPPRPTVPGLPTRRDPRVLHLATALGAGVAVLLVVPGRIGAVAAAAVAAVVWTRSRHWESAAVRRRRTRVEADLPHVVDLMVAALSSGAAPDDALGRVAGVMAAPMSEELSGWVARLRLGADPVSVWAGMARDPQLGRLGVTLQRSAESGAPVVAALTRLAEDLRARRRADVETRVRQVEVRAAVPLGVCLLPSFVLVGVVPLVAGSALGLVAR